MDQVQIEQQHGRFVIVNLDNITFFQIEEVDGRKGVIINFVGCNEKLRLSAKDAEQFISQVKAKSTA